MRLPAEQQPGRVYVSVGVTRLWFDLHSRGRAALLHASPLHVYSETKVLFSLVVHLKKTS